MSSRSPAQALTPLVNRIPAKTAEQVDQVKVFHLFAFFGGDSLRTAAAARVDHRIVEALAHDFNWLSQIKGMNRLDTPDGLEAEQAANRAANYVMAQRLRDVISSVVLDAEKDDTFAKTLCIDVDADGNKTFTPKPLVEIAKASEIVHNLSYRALGDKIGAKSDTVASVDGDRITNLAVNIYQKLTAAAEAVKRVDEVVSVDVATRIIDATGAEEGVVRAGSEGAA